MQADFLADNTTNCFLAIERSIHESSYSAQSWEDVTVDNFDLKIRNNSNVIGNYYANSTSYCFSAFYNWKTYVYLKMEDFPTFVPFLQSFSQNLLGKIFYIRELLNTSSQALEEDDQEEFYYTMGVMIYIIQDIEPVEEFLFLQQMADKFVPEIPLPKLA